MKPFAPSNWRAVHLENWSEKKACWWFILTVEHQETSSINNSCASPDWQPVSQPVCTSWEWARTFRIRQWAWTVVGNVRGAKNYLKEFANVYGSKYLKSMFCDIVSEGYSWSLSNISNLLSNKPINGWGLRSQACRRSYPFILLQGFGSRTITERLVEFSTLATQAQAFPWANPNPNSNHQPATLVSTNIAGS